MAAEHWLTILAQHKSYFALFVVAALCTLVGTPAYAAAAARLGWVDLPGGRKAHGRPVATMGGLVVFAVVFAGVAVTLAWGNRVSAMFREHQSYVLGAVGCTAALLALGAIDDRRGVSPKLKLLVQLLVAAAAYLLGFRIDEITLPWLGSTRLTGLSFLLSVLWIVTIINAINFTDGLDGLAAGVCLIAAAANAGVAVWLGNYYMVVMMLLLAGALAGFLPWNFHPARVFLGDTGSLALGGYLALCSLHSAQKSHTAVMILVPLCALGYPIFDLMLAVARRTLKGQPVWASDRDHIHHRLLARGHTPSQAALLIYVGGLVLIGACLVAMTSHHLAVGLSLAAMVALAFVCVRVLGYFEWRGWRDREERKLLHAAAQLARLKLARAATPAEIVSALGIFATEAGIERVALECSARLVEWPAQGPEAGAATGTERVECDEAFEVSHRLANGWMLHARAIGAAAGDADARLLWDDLCRSAEASPAAMAAGAAPERR